LRGDGGCGRERRSALQEPAAIEIVRRGPGLIVRKNSLVCHDFPPTFFCWEEIKRPYSGIKRAAFRKGNF
jgi:hypothetical protein